MKAIRTLFLLSILLANRAEAQTLPPGRPEQDACNALTVCGTSFSTPYSYSGFGAKKEQSQPAACFDETNSVWLKVVVATPGDISFVITPVFPLNDYDFAVYNITGKTCDSINANTRIRCNGVDIASSPGGQTGLLFPGVGVNTSGPGAGIPYVAPIAAAVGDTYLIMIDNFYQGPQSGFNIDFSYSTATFVTNPAPRFDSIATACSYADSIRVHLNAPIRCASLQANGSDYRLSPSGTIASVTGLSCAAGNGYTQDFTVKFNGPLAAGTYVLKPQNGSDGNTVLDVCNVAQPVSDSIVFTVLQPLNVTAGPDVTTCINNSIQLNAVAGGGPWSSLSYLWSPATSLSSATIADPVATPLNDIVYTVTVTPNGRAECARSANINVRVLQGFYLANHDTTICSGNNVQLSAVGDGRYTYTWTPATSLSNPAIPTPVASPAATTTYTVTASFPGCRDSSNAVTVNVQPGASVYIGPDRTICYNDTIQFNPTITPDTFTAFTYQWSPAGSFSAANVRNPVFYGTDSTKVALTVTTSAGCTGTDTALINVLPNRFIILSADTAICPHESAQLSASGGITYLWMPSYTLSSDTDSVTIARPITTTSYTVYASNALGCRDTQQVTVVVYPAALITLPDSVNIYPGESYQLNPGGNGLYFTWFPLGGLSSGTIANPVASPEVNTRYFVSATTESGCSVSDSIDVNVSLETLIDMPNAFTPGRSPNPVFKPAHLGHIAALNMRIFNRWGERVYESTNVEGGWDGTVNGKPQPLGVYVYMIDARLPNGRIFKKQGNVTLLR